MCVPISISFLSDRKSRWRFLMSPGWCWVNSGFLIPFSSQAWPSPLSRFANWMHGEEQGAWAWWQWILPALGPVESAVCATMLRWRPREAVYVGRSSRKPSKHPDTHFNPRGHCTAHRSLKYSYYHSVMVWTHKATAVMHKANLYSVLQIS